MRNPRPQARRFTVLDAMVFVAATAIGLAGARQSIVDAWPFQRPDQGWTTGTIFGHILHYLPELLLPLITAWTPSILILRLRRPRPSIRCLFLQPGASACGAVSLIMVVGLLRRLASEMCYLLMLSRGCGALMTWWQQANLSFMFRNLAAGGGMVCHSEDSLGGPCFTIVSAWTLLAVSRLCRPEPGWLDRTGRAMGIVWVTLFVCAVLEGNLSVLVRSWFPVPGVPVPFGVPSPP